MDIQAVIFQLIDKGIIQPNVTESRPLHGGTSSQLRVLCYGEVMKYVIKSNSKVEIQVEAQFLDFYREIELLPTLLYVDPSNQFIVYPFLKGETNFPKKNKAYLLNSLVQNLINHYKPTPIQTGWGWAKGVSSSWQEFLLSEVEWANKTIDSNVLPKEDLIFIQNLIKDPKRKGFTKQPFLLHGDCGVHNFLFSNERLSGVIDPMPLIGDPLHDLVFAFCSSPDDLTLETIQQAANILELWERDDQLLYEEVLIGLYIRMARCTIHHPNDFNEYLKAWNDWNKIVGR